MLHSSSAIILAPSSFQDDTTPPTFAGLANVTPDPNGSFLLDWLAAVDPTTPVEYVVYAAKGIKTAAELFIPANKTVITETLTERLVYHGVAKEYFIKNNAYTFGVRAKDGAGNIETNTVVITETALGSFDAIEAFNDALDRLEDVIPSFGQKVTAVLKQTKLQVKTKQDQRVIGILED